MIRWELLDRAATPDGADLTLNRHGRDYIIMANGKSLMSSTMHGSEEALATLGCAHARTLPSPRVLVGGLGMGFTLRATLDTLPAGAAVVVAELMPAVITWNQGPLGPLAGQPLADPRASVLQGDVGATMRAHRGRYDAILLDVDNGPTAFSQASNGSLYDNAGVATMLGALAPNGILAVWSASEDRRFEHRLRHAGFTVRTEVVRARLGKGGPRHVIFLGYLGASARHASKLRPSRDTGPIGRKTRER